MNSDKILTVSQLNTYVKSLLDGDIHLQNIFIEGEISNLSDRYSSGHIYFSLKDNKSLVKAVMFSFNTKKLKFKPENGMKVLILGRVTVYEVSGQYQIYVEDMRPYGVGALAIELEQLKKKLEEKGLFDKAHKKPLPIYPSTIGVITSPTGAAIQDILNIISRRFPCSDIVLAPVLVQGESAPEQLKNAVNMFSDNNAADVIIIGRGGGSIEDLWAFNDEELAYAIYNCKIPIVSAVGHETDFTICDFVSDLRAPTPSAAAELVVPDKMDLTANLNATKQYIDSLIDNKIHAMSEVQNNYIKLVSAYSPINYIDTEFEKIHSFELQINNLFNRQIDLCENNLKKSVNKLEALNPISVLKRGFAHISFDNKNVVSKNDLKIGSEIKLTLSDGFIKANVTKID